MENKMKSAGTVARPQMLHLFKHSHMNFYSYTKCFEDRDGTKRFRTFKGKRKRPKYKRKQTCDERVKQIRARTRKGRDEAVVRHRAAAAAKGATTKRDLAAVINGLSQEEQAALASSPHVVTAVEKIVEAMLFRFS